MSLAFSFSSSLSFSLRLFKREMTTFNMKDGYAEAILRGYKGVLLNSADYALMCQCENLDDLKMHLVSMTGLSLFCCISFFFFLSSLPGTWY